MTDMEIAFSPCPNDTFIFHALTHGLIDTRGYRFHPFLADVETLNRAACQGRYPVTKLSFAALLQLEELYFPLDSGSALGFGCGPLVVAKRGDIDFNSARIAVPGMLTTACLLFRLWQPAVSPANLIETPFETILPGVASGKFDAGLIIHEGRFVVDRYDCRTLIDLGIWWETTTSCPIPLGCIAMRRDMEAHRNTIKALISGSIGYAKAHPQESRPYIRAHAQEMEDEVIDRHIGLYVNAFSMSLGETGRKAIAVLREKWLAIPNGSA